MNFLKLTMIDTPSPRDADASKKVSGGWWVVFLNIVSALGPGLSKAKC